MPAAKILLISADADLTRTMITCLVQADYKVIHTTRGSTVIESVRAEHPNLVILDIQLPDFSSLAIIRLLRAEPFYHHLPIILTGMSIRAEDVLIGLEVGADLCLA